MGEDSRAGALVPGRAPAPGLLENVQPWVALPQSCDRWPHIPASPPWDGLHLLHSHMYPQQRCRRGHGPRPAHSQQCLQNDSRQVHTHLAHTHTLYTHTLNTLTCAPALHSHTPAEAKPSRFGGVVRRLARPLCCPECTPFPQSTMGQRQGLPAKGTVPSGHPVPAAAPQGSGGMGHFLTGSRKRPPWVSRQKSFMTSWVLEPAARLA